MCKYEYLVTWIQNLFHVSGVHIGSHIFLASLFILYFICLFIYFYLFI